MGFSVRIAPGVRVRASRRGLRTSVGPRFARVHVGAGRTGFSTGVGPLSFYQSLGSASGRRGGGGRGSGGLTITEQRRLVAQARAAERAQEIEVLRGALARIQDMHRGEFAPSLPPIAPAPPVVDLASLTSDYQRVAVEGIPLLKRQERGSAKAQAAKQAERDHAAMLRAAGEQHRADQAALDHLWALLCANDPEIVLATLEEAFADNEAPAVAVGVEGDEVTLLVMVPSIDAVPERKPAMTAAGRPTMAMMTKAERNTLYASFVCGHVLLTLKESLAVAPGLGAVRIVVLRREGNDAYGRPRMDCIMAGRWTRIGLDGVQWQVADALMIAHDSSSEFIVNSRAGNDLRAIDTSAEPDIQAVIDAVDVADFDSGDDYGLS